MSGVERRGARRLGLIVCSVVLGLGSSLASGSPSPAGVPIPTGGLHPYGIAIDQANRRAFVSNTSSDSVGVVSLDTGMITGLVRVGTGPSAVALDASRGRVFVGHYGNPNGDGKTITIIDSTTNAVIKSVQTPAQGHVSIDVDEPTGKVYVTGFTSDSVTILDSATGNIITTIPVGKAPTGVAVNSTTGKVYVTSFFLDQIQVISVSSNSVIKVLSDPGAAVPESDPRHIGGPYGVAIDESANRIYVTMYSAWYRTSILDGGTDTFVGFIPSFQTVPFGMSLPMTWTHGLSGVAVDPGRSRLWVVNYKTGQTHVYDTRTLAKVASVTAGPPGTEGPVNVAIDMSNGAGYVTNASISDNCLRPYMRSPIGILFNAPHAVGCAVFVPERLNPGSLLRFDDV